MRNPKFVIPGDAAYVAAANAASGASAQSAIHKVSVSLTKLRLLLIQACAHNAVDPSALLRAAQKHYDDIIVAALVADQMLADVHDNLGIDASKSPIKRRISITLPSHQPAAPAAIVSDSPTFKQDSHVVLPDENDPAPDAAGAAPDAGNPHGLPVHADAC